ncbi:MAG TPA: secondary thiamine-phosphate synthase enzyme YjbQ [Anaeromyxobacter sp.]|nr:secondary thiamine-phosphate synthase enzyme YjbQ [Anaeromyxobacter sp.]
MRLPDLEVRTGAARELVEITGPVRAALRAARVREGLLVVASPHTTAGVTVQENADPDVRRDLLLALSNAIPDAPPQGRYRHAEGNSPAHAMTSLVGTAATLIVEDGELVLGTWQGVYLCEFDGPRTRTVMLKVIPG